MNFIVIVSDTLRYDHLGANGNTWIKTPELDAFSRQAVNFDRCTISSFPTVPTRTDWFTGRYSFPFHGWQPLDPKATVLAGVLGEAGSVSQLITDCPHLMNATQNFQRGFHGAEWIRGQEGDTPLTWMNHPLPEIVPFEKTRQRPEKFGATLVNLHRWQNRWWDGEEDTFVARTCRTAAHWLEHNYKAERFLLWVDCFDAHVPLMIYAPGVDGGRRVGAPVQPPDIMPTLLDLAGVPAPPGLHGHSLVPLLRGEESGWPRRAAFSGTDLTRGEGKNAPKITV